MAGTLPRAFAVRPDAREGSVELGSFRILGRLGEGGFAEAYLAQQLGTERRAVLKIAHRRLMRGAGAAQLRERFHDEARASTRVQHPNLATVYTCGETSDGLPAIAMEFVPGDAMESYLHAKAPLAAGDMAYFYQLASALAAIHRHGIVHRDVTPRNIVLGCDHAGEQRATLLDFGIAQLPNTSPSKQDVVVGTPRYIAPEQLQGRAMAASDMFSLGAILWWALTGAPYLEELETVGEVLRYQMNPPLPPDPRERRADVPEDLAQLTRKLLHPNAKQRPTAEAVLHFGLDSGALSHARVSRRRPRATLSRQARHTVQDVAAPSVDGVSKLRTLVVEPNEVMRATVEGYLRRLGCAVTAKSHPRQATRGTAGSQDIIAISSVLPRLTPDAVVAHLREHFPSQKLVLLCPEESDGTLAQLDVDLVVRVPGDLVQLAEFVRAVGERVERADDPPLLGSADTMPMWKQTSEPAQPSLRSVDHFMGAVPEWIAEIEDCFGSGLATRGMEACRRIQAAADAIGAERLAHLAATFQALVKADEVIDPAIELQRIESEYEQVFRSLMERRAALNKRERSAS